MKILDILSEAPAGTRMDDGTSSINNETLTDLIRTARDRWLTAVNTKGADPAKEQQYVEKFIAQQEMYRPEPDTMQDGPFRMAAQARYGKVYHRNDPAWNHDIQQNTMKSGNVYDAPDSALDAQNMGGDIGNLGNRAGRQNIDNKKAAAAGEKPIQQQAQVYARGQTPRKEVDSSQFLNRNSSRQYQSDTSVSAEEKAAHDARLAPDDEALGPQPQAGEKSQDQSGMTTKQKRQANWAKVSNRAK